MKSPFVICFFLLYYLVMSIKDSNSSQREDIINQGDVNRFQYVDDQKVGEFDGNNNNTFPLPSYNQNSKRSKSNMAFGKGKKLRVDQLSAQDIQAILMENYSLRQEIEALSHQFAIEKMSLHRHLRHVTARNQYLEEEMRLTNKKRYRQKQDAMIIDEINKKGSLLERRKSLNDIEGPLYEDDHPVYPSYNNYYYDKCSFNNEEEDPSQDFQYENENYPIEDDGGFFKPHPYSSMHPPPPPPHPNFGPMSSRMSYHIRHHQGPPPPPQTWIMNDMAYDPPRSLHRRRSRSSKGMYNEEDNPENEESMLHLMQQMVLDPLSLRPSMPILSPQSQHPLNNSRRRKASFT